ncbi:MAG: STAS domain-containing protein [Syntrophothermus sp.]
MLNIETVQKDNLNLMLLNGRIDGLSCPDLEKEFSQLIEEGKRFLAADFTNVSYISSAGLRVLVSTQKRLKKIGGDLSIAFPAPHILEVFNISGLAPVFRIVNDLNELQQGAPTENTGISSAEINGINTEILNISAMPGQLITYGSQTKLDTSSYSEQDVVKITAGNIKFGTGLAAPGSDYNEYKDLFGETVIINKNFYYYPALKKSYADFMLAGQTHQDTCYNFLHGFGFNGSWSKLIGFEREEKPVELNEVAALAAAHASSNVFGVVLLAESSGLRGMSLKRIPIEENKPESGSVFDQKNFGDWIDFPLEASFNNHIAAAAGLMVKDKSALSDSVKLLFPSDSNFHIHAAVFEKGSLNKNIQKVDTELNRVLNELEVVKVQHLLGTAKFRSGIIAIISLETD